MTDPIVETQLPPQSLAAPDSPDWWWVWTPDPFRPEGTWTPVKVMGESGKPGTWHAAFNNSMLTLSDIAKRMPDSRWVKHVSPALSAPPVTPAKKK